jgi:hypothetical protein
MISCRQSHGAPPSEFGATCFCDRSLYVFSVQESLKLSDHICQPISRIKFRRGQRVHTRPQCSSLPASVHAIRNLPRYLGVAEFEQEGRNQFRRAPPFVQIHDFSRNGLCRRSAVVGGTDTASLQNQFGIRETLIVDSYQGVIELDPCCRRHRRRCICNGLT